MVPLSDAVRSVTVDARGSRWSCREREWRTLALAVALAAALFSVWPDLDLWVSAAFHRADSGFVGDADAVVRAVYIAVPWIGRVMTLIALAIAVCPRRLTAGPGRRWRRRAMALALVMLLGVGLVVNGALKEHWGRARPATVQTFGGGAVFEPALRPSEQCRHNCSFVSGHAATGFALVALGMFGAPATRRRWLVAGLSCGGVLGLMRVTQGGHFLSDVVCAGLVIWIVSAVLREALLVLEWRRRRRRGP